MKTLILLVGLLTCVFTSSEAQKIATLKSLSNYTVEDTVVNTTPKTQRIASNAYSPAAYIKATVTKISGTVAGTLVAAGSYSGTVTGPWYPLDTLTATDVASQEKFLEIKDTKYFYYRVLYTGTGTMSAKLRSQIVAK